jgi:hypothetical protein
VTASLDDRIAALLGGSAASRDLVQLAKDIGDATVERRAAVMDSLSNPGRSEADRRSLEPLVNLVGLIHAFGVSAVLQALERAGKHRRRERARK